MIIGVFWEQLPLVNKAKEMGFETVVTTVWDKEKIDANIIYEVDSRNLEKLEEIYLKEKPDAVIADECDYSMYAVAFLTDKYKLPGPNLHPLTVTNNKYLQRKVLGETDVYQPQYELCWNFDCVEKAADKIGYPVILKPIDNRGSIGVLIAENREKLDEAWFNAVSNSHSRMCLVEKVIRGDHIAVDGFLDSNKFFGLCVSTKQKYSESIILDKLLYFPGIVSKKIKKEAIEISEKVVGAIKINFGYIHAEYIIEKETRNIYLIEIANRGGGVHISNKILPVLTGIDLQEKYIQMAMGKKITLEWDGDYKNKVIMYFINPQGKKSPEEITEKYKDNILAFWLKDKRILKNIKTQGALGRAGMVILCGKNFEELEEIGRNVENEIGLINYEYYWGGFYT